MIIYVVGVPGVGKTTIIKESMKYIKKDIEIVNVGDIMQKFLEDKIKNRDDIRKLLSDKEIEDLQIKTFEYIKEKYNGKNIILDTHFIIETNKGYKSGLLRKLSGILIPNVIITIISDPEDILNRRIKDKSRQRDIEDEKYIEIQQNLTLYFSLQLMFEYDSLLKIIFNKEGSLDNAIKQFADYINSIL